MRKVEGRRGGKEGEKKDGEGTKIGRERELRSVLMAHKPMKLLQITFLSCADLSMPSLQ